MPIYHQLGEVPRKRHVAFRKEDGGIHYEELVGNEGFTGPSSLLYHLRTPKRYRNEHGQLTEMAPFSERDVRRPARLARHDETGDFPVVVKSGNRLGEMVMAHHPFDVVGGDGYYYPWAFSIDDFEPEAVPAPYDHQNVMSDEVLFHAGAEFTSRRGIEYGSITLHPDGLPHGPQPGRTEESIRAKGTDEVAVMVDTFRPLLERGEALPLEDEGYPLSWLEGSEADR